MAVTLRNVLHIEKMKDAVVLAGNSALDRQVRRIATIEKPFVDHAQYSYEVAAAGDLYLSKLHVFQNEEVKFLKELCFMRDTESCGLVTDEDAVNQIPSQAISMADQYGVPIIVISRNLGFAELTYQIIDLIIQDKMDEVNKHAVERLLKNDVEPQDIRESFLHIQPSLCENVTAIYASSDEKINPGLFLIDDNDVILPLFQGILYIMSFDKEDRCSVGIKVRQFSDKLKSTISEFHMGQSRIFNCLEDCKPAVLEAIYACTYAEFIKSHACDFTEMGEYGMLLEVENKNRLREYRDRIYNTLSGYDKENHLGLISLLELLVESEGSYKYIANKLFIHETTVRYRLNKIRDILDLHNWTTFYADVRTAVYADWILNHQLLEHII